MPETLPNSPEARTQTGEIQDQSQPIGTTTDAGQTTTKTPIEYTAFKAPDGITLDSKALDGATAIFRELGLNQAQAQQLIDFQLSRDAELNNKSAEAYDRMRADWRKQVETDPVLGGTNLENTKAEIGKAVAILPTELQTAFKDAMNLTGAGDNPAIVKAFYILSKSVNESRDHISGAGPSAEGQVKPGTSSRPSAAQAMFPNLPSGQR